MTPRVGIVGVARTTYSTTGIDATIAELVLDVSHRAVAASGIARRHIGVTISASSDVVDGRPFAFTAGLEALAAWPPIEETHIEMDGAWAAFAAWVKLLAGAADAALVVAWAKPTEASLTHVTNSQLDPFTLAPLGIDGQISAALQADAWAARTGSAAPGLAVAPPADGACAIVLATESVAARCPGPVAWIVGADHRTETAALGHRDLSRITSATAAADRARGLAGWEPGTEDVAELTVRFAHQRAMLADALAIDAGTPVDPSGGLAVGDPWGVAGLDRIAEAVAQVTDQAGAHQVPGARRALAHASAGHALQQNLVMLVETLP